VETTAVRAAIAEKFMNSRRAEIASVYAGFARSTGKSSANVAGPGLQRCEPVWYKNNVSREALLSSESKED
jgi:hypothetical protein